MKIAVITPGRSHLLDMSLQLIKCGHDVTFYTMVPKKRCEKFGLKKSNVVSFFPICAPLMLLFRKVKLPFDGNRLIYYWVSRIVDYLSCFFLKKCDIVITISGCSIKAIKKAKIKYNACVICDRGCKHILSQQEILRNIPSAKQVYLRDILIELKQYAYADFITLPSIHAKESFIVNGISPQKLFVNPYGVNIDSFYPIVDAVPKYDVIFVGNWSYQKGVDLLIDACKKGKFSLLHVGAIIDCPFPFDDDLFVHVSPVNQLELVKYYAQAKTLALPSRQDGFGLVLFQAMACGLPLVYSHETGGPDLKALITNKDFLVEMNDFSVESLIDALNTAIKKYELLKVSHSYLTKADFDQITWEAYGKRYNNFLLRISKHV